MHSYHIFYFPFKWKIKGREKQLFAEQTNLDNIVWNPYSNWLENPEITDDKEIQNLYNEKNYFHEFVHPVLYDTGKENSILKHFERKEPQQRDVCYIISKRGGKTYTLRLDAMNLNLYETGVGMLTFFLTNDRDDQKDPEDILTINQYGRRILPPFFVDITEKIETAEYLSIEGLNGEPSLYYEDFSSYANGDKLLKEPWTPACFIINLITDLYAGFEIIPVIDDRMFVNCWYGNNELSKTVAAIDTENPDCDFLYKDNFWYNYVFVDKPDDPTCKNRSMRKKLTDESLYKRWQNSGTLYGVSKYSFVALADRGFFGKDILSVHMRTIYSRMVELVLIQRASILRFSDEIARVGQLSKIKSVDEHLIDKISSIYKEYIRFTNQIYFREITAQDQGIELYNLMSETLNLKEYAEGLDKEIGELHNYVTLVDDKTRNKNAAYLNKIATIFLPATMIAGLFGMNAIQELSALRSDEGVPHGEIMLWQFLVQLGIIGIVCLIAYQFFKKK